MANTVKIESTASIGKDFSGYWCRSCPLLLADDLAFILFNPASASSFSTTNMWDLNLSYQKVQFLSLPASDQALFHHRHRSHFNVLHHCPHHLCPPHLHPCWIEILPYFLLTNLAHKNTCLILSVLPNDRNLITAVSDAAFLNWW